METDSYSANQRRAINLVWTACGDYQFEPQFLALKADGTPEKLRALDPSGKLDVVFRNLTMKEEK